MCLKGTVILGGLKIVLHSQTEYQRADLLLCLIKLEAGMLVT
jgi:hypothetical protein